MTSYDVLVIGSGPGGYVAAIRASKLGLKTGIVERSHLGGICLNWGCIPSKALLKTAEVHRLAKRGRDFGVSLEAPPAISLSDAVKRSRDVSRDLNTGVAHLLSSNGVDVIWGEAKLSSRNNEIIEIDVAAAKSDGFPQHPAPDKRLGPGRYSAKHVILATGARPRIIPGLEPDEKHIWTYFRALRPDVRPESLIVVGSGAIGAEFATFYRQLGSQVLLVEVMDRILPSEDPEISQIARRQFIKQGIKILTGAKIRSASIVDDAVAVTIESSSNTLTEHRADRVISAAGVVPNTESLGLQSLEIKTQSGWIVTDNFGRTSCSGVYAIGDVAGPPMLAHKAEHEAIACVDAIFDGSTQSHPAIVPACTFTHPHIATVGLTEDAAKAKGFSVRVGRFPLRANGRALATGEPEGLIKTVFDGATGRFLGAQMIGAEVSELIGIVSTALAANMTMQQFKQVMLPHPTIAEALYESVLDAGGNAIHI